MNNNKCKVVILDEVTCTFVGLHPDHVMYFYEEYGVFANNHFFNPKFKLGSWDGKIRHFHKTGKTYINLLPDIIPRVIRLGYSVAIDDRRTNKSIDPPVITKDFFEGVFDRDTGEPWTMREYQVDMVNALLQNGGGVGIAGTGAGKTSMTAAIALAYEQAANFRSIIIVPDKNLTDQTFREYEFFGLDVGEYSGERKDTSHQHIVSTWQALQNNPTILQTFQVIIVDEAHGIRGKTLTELLNNAAKSVAYRFGVTGTLPKEPADAMAVRIAVGDVQYTIPAHVLIDQGYLAKLQIDIYQLDINLRKQYNEYLEEDHEKVLTYKQFKDSYFPDWHSEKRFLQTEKERLAWIVDLIESKRSERKGNVFCLVDGVRFGKKLTEMIDGAVFVYGKDKMADRRRVYDLFKENDNLVVIANVQVASTGLDIKRIFNLMFIDVGKSFIRVIQTIGRGLRKAPDKDEVNVSDVCSDLKYSKRHLRERTKFYKEQMYPYNKKVVDYSSE